MIHVFHGFLGSPSDFDFLKGEDILLHDLLGDLDQIQVSPEDTLIGYSMGGRIALELASRLNFVIKKLVLINAHSGLSSDAEKIERKDWENKIEGMMLESGFFSYWNSLPIFSHDRPLQEFSTERLNAFKNLFHRFRLSEQKDFLPEISLHKNKVLWIIGQDDQKYHAWAHRELLPREIPCRFTFGGHRLFQHPEKVIQVLKEEGVL